MRDTLLWCSLFAVAQCIGAVVIWRLGRALRAGAAADALYVERVQLYRNQLGVIVLVSALVPILFYPFMTIESMNFHSLEGFAQLPGLGLLSVCIAWLVATLTDFPTRKIIFAERWGLLEYLDFVTRWLFAFGGFWLTLMAAPFLVLQADSQLWFWTTALSLAAALVGWSHHHDSILIRLLRARPLENASLRRRLQQITERSDAAHPPPEILVSGPANGVWANAIALPSLRRRRIVMSRPLLDALDEDETAAIFGHEVAHLEKYDHVRLRKVRLMETALIVTACLILPRVASFDPSVAPWMVGFLWGICILFYLAIRARRVQRDELEADLRGAQLCGNTEALVSALVKLHNVNRVPRSVAYQIEAGATHPSLFHRIQHIRSTAAIRERTSLDNSLTETEENEVGERFPRVFVSRDKDTELLVLQRDHALWLTLPDGASHRAGETTVEKLQSMAVSRRTTAYNRLAELRILLKRHGAFVRAIENVGKPIAAVRPVDFPLRQNDHGRAKETVEAVESQLASLSEVRSLSGVESWVRTAAMVIGFAGIFASFQGVITTGMCLWLLILCLPAASVASRPWVNAFGTVAIVAAVASVLLTADRTWWSPSGWALLVLIGILGVVCLWHGRRRASDEAADSIVDEQSEWTALLMLATFLILVTVGLLESAERPGNTVAKLYSLGANAAALFLPVFAAAAALITAPQRWATFARLGLVVVGLAPALLGSQWFLEQIVMDPFVAVENEAESEYGTVADAAYVVKREWLYDGEIDGVWLAPGGKHFAVRKRHEHHARSSDGPHDDLAVFAISDWYGRLSELEAMSMVFAGPDTALTVVPSEHGVELQSQSISEPQRLSWSLELPDAKPSDHCLLAANGKRWRLILNPGQERTVRLSGIIGSSEIERATWSEPTEDYRWRYVGDGQDILQITWDDGKVGQRGSLQRLRSAFGQFHRYNRIDWARVNDGLLKPASRTLAHVDAKQPKPGYTRYAIAAYGRDRGHLWLSRREGSSHPQAWEWSASIGLNFGWQWDGHWLVVLERDELLVVDAERRRKAPVALPRPATREVHFNQSGSAIVIAWPSGDGYRTTIQLIENPLDPIQAAIKIDR